MSQKYKLSKKVVQVKEQVWLCFQRRSPELNQVPLLVIDARFNWKKAGNSLIFYSFKPFIIWNFAITKRFFRGTYFIKVFLLLLFFSETALLFILNFYHALKSCLIMEFTHHIRLDIIISLWLSLSLKLWIWYRRENKVEKFYNHDGQKIGFYKKVHIKRYRLGKNKDILLMLCIARNEKKI